MVRPVHHRGDGETTAQGLLGGWGSFHDTTALTLKKENDGRQGAEGRAVYRGERGSSPRSVQWLPARAAAKWRRRITCRSEFIRELLASARTKSFALPQTNSAAATALDHAHWKLNPPRWPVTSTTSPMKNSPGSVLHSIDLDDRTSVSTPPRATSAVR